MKTLSCNIMVAALWNKAREKKRGLVLNKHWFSEKGRGIHGGLIQTNGS
jgi:hypothetical protein